ncbi:unnamed protein product [Schistosoma margrebowiei]|uniref:Uncharacterized protein n=1 Tax=Schistosoma margrebowiei TaxID=48269 RepID=A0A3P8A832_9TREM|nr:unnamed protein product [Schistosoma margrebowiei]
MNDETSTIGDFNDVTMGNASVVSENRKLRKVLRNPITGEGMCDSDYIDLLKLPSEYYFRRNRDTLSSTLNIHSHSPPIQPSSTTTPSTNTAAAVKKAPAQKDANPTSKLTANKPRHQTPPPPSQLASTQQPSKLEPKVEKSTPQPIVVDWIMKRKHGIQWKARMQLDDFDYEVDRTLLSHTHEQMQVKAVSVAEASASVGLHIHKGKSEILKYNTENTNPITLDGETLEEMETSTYLSSVIDKLGGSDANVNARISKVSTAFLEEQKKVIRPKKIEVPTEKPVKENKQPVTSVTQSQPIIETQVPTKEAEPQAPKAVEEPQTLETEKQQTPKEVAKPKTSKTEKLEIPKETVKPQTPETKEPQTTKEATNLQTLGEIPQAPKEVAKTQTPKIEELKTSIPQIPGETVELHTPVETPITLTSHTLTESTIETKSAGKPLPQSLSEELKSAIDESETPQPATFSANDKIPDEVSEDKHSPAVESPPISEARLSVDNKMPQLPDAQTSKEDLTPKSSTESPETGQV